MSQLLSLGAINKLTGEYVYPKIANKKDEYICPECNKDLILVQGKIRVHHFRHKVDSINPCHHYSKPTESQIHKDAKMLMKTLLENKTHIQFIRECVSCKISAEINLPEITEGSIITLEHRFNYDDELRIADVAHTLNDEIKGIYEICHTHKTCSENRPEPWVEIDANLLLTLVNTNTNNEPLIINCIRCEKCEKCKNELIKIYKDKKVAIDIFVKWIGKGDDILPFVFRDFDGIHIPRIGEHSDYRGTLCKYNYTPDIIIFDKSNDRYYIDLTPNKYSIEFKQELDDYGIGVYYIDINWILQQISIPTKIECIKITDKYNNEPINNNVRNISYGIDTNKFVYLNVEFSKKDLIKDYGGKWDKENKLWYITKSVYNKNKTYIDEFIGYKIIWNNCCHCNGTGYFAGDDCWFC